MNTAELAACIADKHGISKSTAKEIVASMFEAITHAAVDGSEVSLAGFGKFAVRKRAARQGRNPATGASIKIAASKNLGFTPAKAVRDALNAAPKAKSKK